MARTWTIIGVADVAASFEWCRSLLGLPESAPAHDHFGQLADADGTVLLCLHVWGAHEHPPLTRSDLALPGNGLLRSARSPPNNAGSRRTGRLREGTASPPGLTGRCTSTFP